MGMPNLQQYNQHLLGPENPLKSIDFTGPGGGLVPIAPPEYAPESFVW